jgi:hypothetical protein
MTVETLPGASQAAILGRIIRPRRADLSAAAARAWLALDFDQDDRARMHELALKAQDGTLQPDELIELDNYRHVGRLLDMMHSKARLSLKLKQLGRNP